MYLHQQLQIVEQLPWLLGGLPWIQRICLHLVDVFLDGGEVDGANRRHSYLDHVGPEVVLEFGLWLFIEFKIFATQVALELDGLVQTQTIEIS